MGSNTFLLRENLIRDKLFKMASYGTQYTALRSDLEVVNELKSNVTSNKRMLCFALAGMAVFSILTFSAVLVATEHSKEFGVVGGVLTDKVSNSVVATRSHEEMIENPLSLEGANGVKFITLMAADGSMSRHSVVGFSRESCEVGSDGYCYTFSTGSGEELVGYESNNADGQRVTSFRSVTQEEKARRRSLLSVDETSQGFATGSSALAEFTAPLPGSGGN